MNYYERRTKLEKLMRTFKGGQKAKNRNGVSTKHKTHQLKKRKHMITHPRGSVSVQLRALTTQGSFTDSTEN